LLCIYLNFKSAKRCKQNAELYLVNPYLPVYDILHKFMPRIPLHVPDYLILLSTIFAFIKEGSIITTRINTHIPCLIFSLLLRSIVTRLTIIPTCMPKPRNNTNYYSQIFTSTHDLMYSGHTILFIFLGKIVEEDYYSNIFLYLSGKVIQFIFPISLILSRQHYTNDIVVSIIVYNFFFLYLKS